MIKRLREKQRSNGEFGTTALPDIIFMLLFFFMVTTVVRDEEPKVQVEKPSAVHAEQFDEKSLSSTLWLGRTDEGSLTSIQIDDRLVDVDQVGSVIAEQRAQLPEALAGKFTVILKADKDLPMEVITAVKQELRDVNALKLHYAVVDVDATARN